MMTTKAPTATSSGFDTEAHLSKASLLTYALQGLYTEAESGSEIEAAHIGPIFELSLELARQAQQLHGRPAGEITTAHSPGRSDH